VNKLLKWSNYKNNERKWRKKIEVVIGRVGSGSDRTSRISLTFWKKSGRVNLYVVFFQIFDRFWFDWRSFDLRSDQFDFFFKLDQIGLRYGRIGQVSEVESDSATFSNDTPQTVKLLQPIYYYGERSWIAQIIVAQKVICNKIYFVQKIVWGNKLSFLQRNIWCNFSLL
jgi:hypothetical protein